MQGIKFPDTAAITGASGFIGLRFSELLASQGTRVSGLDLREPPTSGSQLRSVDEKTFERFVVGDLSDPEIIEEWLDPLPGGKGRVPELVIHCAAIVADNGDWNLFNRVNRDSASLVARACWKKGVRKFVFLSSVMVYGFSFPEDVSEDSDPEFFRGERNPYCQTKIEAEALLSDLRQEIIADSKRDKMEIFVVRPGDVIGPRSTWIEPPLHIMERLGGFLIPEGGFLNPIFVDNLFLGLALVVDKGVDGEAYTVTDGEKISYHEFYSKLSLEVFGAKKIHSAPFFVVTLLILVLQFVVPFLVKLRLMKNNATQLNLSTESVKFLSRPARYGTMKIRALGFTPMVSFEEAFEKSVSPYRK